jgi:hypothetical protein
MVVKWSIDAAITNIVLPMTNWYRNGWGGNFVYPRDLKFLSFFDTSRRLMHNAIKK